MNQAIEKLKDFSNKAHASHVTLEVSLSQPIDWKIIYL